MSGAFVRTYVRDLAGPSRRPTSARARRQEPHRGRAGSVRGRVRPARRGPPLVELYAEKGDRKYERAALKYLARYLAEENPSLMDLAQVAGLLAERGLLMRGL